MQKLIILLGLVVVAGAGAHWYLASMNKTEVVPPTTATPATTETVEVETEVDTQAEAQAEIETPASAAPVVPTVPVVTTPVVDQSEEVKDTLSDLDGMFDDEYDDSALDASFEDNLDQSYGF